jgi:hypothetical protein
MPGPLSEARLHRVKAVLLKPAALGALVGLAIIGAGMIFASFAFAPGVAASTASSVCGSPPATSAILTSAQIAGVATSGTDASPSASASPTDTPSSGTASANAPSAPLNLVASAGDAQVTGSWSVPTSNGGSPITGYDVYRGTSPAGESATPIATIASGTNFTDTGLTNGTTYYYTVAAVNAVGISASSAEASATPATVPSAPQALTATSGNGSATLSWSLPASNGGAAVTGYDVYRGTTSGGESAIPIATDVSGTTFTDTGLTNGTTYYYTVAAINVAGVSPQSAEASATPIEPQLCVLVQTYPSATTTVTAGGTASFVVWVWSTGATSTNVSVLASVTAASYLGTPSYAICPSASGTTCTIASLPVGQVYELLVSESVATTAPPAASVAFTARASATGALPFSASATETVAATSSAAVSTSTTAVPPLVSLPAIPGTSVSAVNPSQLFPTVSPSSGSGKLRLPGHRSAVHVAAVSSTVPIDARLIGAQLVGLAVLVGAVTIAIVRMSLRRRLPVPAPPADAVKD